MQRHKFKLTNRGSGLQLACWLEAELVHILIVEIIVPARFPRGCRVETPRGRGDRARCGSRLGQKKCDALVSDAAQKSGSTVEGLLDEQ